MQNVYFSRYAEENIKEALETSGVVVIEGPKFCGKTTTSFRFSKSHYQLDTKSKIIFAAANPEAILLGENPRLIDEWQMVPDLWNCARTIIDKRDIENKFGQFIFTGSSTPAEMDDIYHTGSGRIVKVMMRPMSLYESGESNGKISLMDLFQGPRSFLYLNQDYSIFDTAVYICRGGWPLSVIAGREKGLKITENYASTLFEFENSKNKKFRNKKKDIFSMILRSYARNISTEARRKTLINDVNLHDDRNLDSNTFDEYLEALKDLYIIKDVEAWNPNFRSKTSIVTTPTRHFVDTSIATYVLGMTPYDLIEDPNTFGFMFEDFAVKELSIYASAIKGEIRHYRDGNGLECDAVLHLKSGNYCLIEIKLGGFELIKEGINNLNRLRNKLSEDGQKLPKFLMVITGCGEAYVSNEGVYVVPINMLKA